MEDRCEKANRRFEEQEHKREKQRMKAQSNHERKEMKRKMKQEAKQPKRESYTPPPPPEPRGLTISYVRFLNLKILGLDVIDDNPVKIRSSYRRLALMYHPDKNGAPDAEEKFKKIVVAYERLMTEFLV
jgi:hypothetical protein